MAALARPHERGTPILPRKDGILATWRARNRCRVGASRASATTCPCRRGRPGRAHHADLAATTSRSSGDPAGPLAQCRTGPGRSERRRCRPPSAPALTALHPAADPRAPPSRTLEWSLRLPRTCGEAGGEEWSPKYRAAITLRQSHSACRVPPLGGQRAQWAERSGESRCSAPSRRRSPPRCNW